MKKLSFLIVSLILSLNIANASDLISKASNGVLNENSLGVKKLSDEEMKSVVGGWFDFQRASRYDFSGGVRSYAYLVFDTTDRYGDPYLSAAQKLGFGSDTYILAKQRWVSGRVDYYMQSLNVRTGATSDLWAYGTLNQVYQTFKRYY